MYCYIIQFVFCAKKKKEKKYSLENYDGQCSSASVCVCVCISTLYRIDFISNKSLRLSDRGYIYVLLSKASLVNQIPL